MPDKKEEELVTATNDQPDDIISEIENPDTTGGPKTISVIYYGIYKYDPATKNLVLIQFTTDLRLCQALGKDFGLIFRKYVSTFTDGKESMSGSTNASKIIAEADERYKKQKKE